MDILKSSRHSKLAGSFGEALILYWLSKYGFECALVDHTGIDIIASRAGNGEVMGISVKSRTRSKGTEATHLAVRKRDIRKAEQACRSFGCAPYFAFVIDGGDTIRGYILSKDRLLTIYPGGAKVLAWQMSERRIKQYREDPDIRVFELKSQTHRWWG
jgi:Holliday junction resolvase-like predicted endonuclease